MNTGNLKTLARMERGGPNNRGLIGGNRNWVIALPYSGFASEEFAIQADRTTSWKQVAAFSGRLVRINQHEKDTRV